MSVRKNRPHLQMPAPRTVVHDEALAWLAAHPAPLGASVITSLPDVSEISKFNLEQWREWFVVAAGQVIDWIPPDGVAIFFQSDIRHSGQWIDKGYLVQKAGEQTGAFLLWHKIMCRLPPGSISGGRPTYSHLVCFCKKPRKDIVRPGPDVLADVGAMDWPRAMGSEACKLACRFVYDETDSHLIVDPFCGQGAVLAAANAAGFAALGVDLSAKRCRAALVHGSEKNRRFPQLPLMPHLPRTGLL